LNATLSTLKFTVNISIIVDRVKMYINYN